MARALFAIAACVLAALVLDGVMADTYLHNPRGSNNRLNERSANRNNGNRLFDSQNNNRGGYNKGDYDTDAASGNPADTLALQYKEQYDEYFYMSEKNYLDSKATEFKGKSYLTIEWTNQHGCGGNEQTDPHSVNCDIILQYMCFPEPLAATTDPNYPYSVWNKVREDCTKECYVPTTANPDCSLLTPACPTLPLEGNSCTLAGGLWLDARAYDEFNCPHSCQGSPTSASRATCNANSGSWQIATTRPNSNEPFPRLRDGTTTDRQEYNQPGSQTETEAQRYAREWQGGQSVRLDRALHEDWEWYDECYRRERNAGLFTADQNLRQNNLGYSSAVFTRQNPNDNRRGYECPEERDYWPYWHPSPWTDIAVLTDRLDLCAFRQAESQNVKGKWLCRNTATCPNCIRYNNEIDCRARNGSWVEVGAKGVPAPECIEAPWTRDNHNGNTRGGQASSYNWTLPYLSLPNGNTANYKCAFRLRYNISTDDYDGYMVNSSFNQNNNAGIKSPVQQNPNVIIGAKNQALRLAINTAQYGRTFQDRSHVFTLKPRPYAKTTATTASLKERTIYNVNVRGKRGNIVQVYPAVEYDFIPNQLHIKDSDLVHFQWTGSNTHNNGHPAGDGQAGDAGEGTGGTDRHNVVELDPFNFQHSFPQTWEQNSMFTGMKAAFSEFYTEDGSSDWRLNWALRMATSGFYTSYNGTLPNGDTDTNNFLNKNTQLDPLLNNARPSFEGGLFQFARGTYNYMCTRNHNFSNRDQKGALLVAPSK